MNELDTITFVTDIGNTKSKEQASVTRQYESWELSLLKNSPDETYHATCERCGLEIVGQPSNMYGEEYGRLIYSLGFDAKICYPCRREQSRVKRLNDRRKKREKHCLECNSFFSATRSDTKFCSASCKQSYFRKNR